MYIIKQKETHIYREKTVVNSEEREGVGKIRVWD